MKLWVPAVVAASALLLGLAPIPESPVSAQGQVQQSAAQRCFEHHRFGANPVDVAKTADGQTVLAQTSWNWHDAIGCYLTLDNAALAALRAAPPPRGLPNAPTDTSKRCFEHHRFGERPVDVAKTADGQTVLARLSWGHHDSIGCYLTLDNAALAALRAGSGQADPAEALADAVAALPAVMAEAERNGTWIVSLSDVGAWTWDADDGLRVVVVRIPVGDPNFRILLDNSAVDRDIAVADTAENRQWVQDCMRGDERFELFRQQTVDILTGAMDAPPVTPERARESYANRTLSNGRSCLGGLGGFEELRAHYWWTDAGLDCASRQSMAYAQEGDRVKRPLEVCPTISHNPATAPEWPALDAQQRLADPPEAVRWLMARCQEIVAANPNPAYPTDPYGPYLTGDPLPTCWDDKVAVITGHAASAAVNTMAGASAVSHAHRCYHAFLGYAWARQTGRESRGPNNLEIGCYYYAHRAVP